MKRIMICHLLPIERYPPVTNLLRLLSKETDLQLRVCTARNADHLGHDFRSTGIKIMRYSQPMTAGNILIKIWSHFQMIVGPLFQMIFWRPDKILYYEPHSSFPVYLYKKYLNKKAEILIHNHEYYSKDQFHERGMGLVRYFHHREVSFLYQKASWISQTNRFRLELFFKDYPNLDPDCLKILANYPPGSWFRSSKVKTASKKIRMLYIGALSFENTFIREIVEYSRKRQEEVHLTIYSNNLKTDVVEYLNASSDQGLTFINSGIPYDQIPSLATEFDVGLVLYKGHNLNYRYNAPNKLFEYLALGLEVFVPIQLEGCRPYYKSETRPTVTPINFEALNDEIITRYNEYKDRPFNLNENSCEEELRGLLAALKS